VKSKIFIKTTRRVIMKKFFSFLLFAVLLFCSASAFAQKVMIGPRLTGNFNIYNQKGLTGSWNGIGVGIGGTVDVSFSQHIGLIANLTFFDMRGYSYSVTVNQTTVDKSRSRSYLSVDPMFKAEFSGFYMVGGPSIGIKLASSGENVQTITGQTPTTTPVDFDTNTLRFDIAVGTGYTFKLSEDMGLGTDFMAYIPLTDTHNFPGTSNSIFTLKLGVALKFRL
jgi:hypothetical protein